jgi:hypothetical protein
MAAWEPIKRAGHPDVKGVHPRHPNRLDVIVPLSARPPVEWERYFVGSYTDNPRRPFFRESGIPAPSIEGVSIRIVPLDNELEGWMKGIDASIEEANSFYERVVLPEVQRKEEAARQAEDERQRRVEEARRRAEEL